MDSKDLSLKKKSTICIGEFGSILPKGVFVKTINQLLNRSKNKDSTIVRFAAQSIYVLASHTGEMMGEYIKDIIPL